MEKVEKESPLLPEEVRNLKKTDRMLLRHIAEKNNLSVPEAWAKYGPLFDDRDRVEELKETFGIAKESWDSLPEGMQRTRRELDQQGANLASALSKQLNQQSQPRQDMNFNDLLKAKIAGVFEDNNKDRQGEIAAFAQVFGKMMEQMNQNQSNGQTELVKTLIQQQQQMLQQMMSKDEGSGGQNKMAALLYKKLDELNQTVKENQVSEQHKLLKELTKEIKNMRRGTGIESMDDLQQLASKYGLELKRPSSIDESTKKLLKNVIEKRGPNVDLDTLVDAIESGTLDTDILQQVGKDNLDVQDTIDLIKSVSEKVEKKKDVEAKRQTRKTRIEGTVDIMKSLGIQAIKDLGKPLIKSVIGEEGERMSDEEIRNELEKAKQQRGQQKQSQTQVSEKEAVDKFEQAKQEMEEEDELDVNPFEDTEEGTENEGPDSGQG